MVTKLEDQAESCPITYLVPGKDNTNYIYKGRGNISLSFLTKH
jgi:hypothetical protein